MSFLEGKKIVIMGVANKKSIAWGCAEAMLKQGAEIIYTYQNERMKKSLVKLVGEEAFTVECDVSSDESIEKAMNAIGEYAGEIHGLVHAVAYANKEELSGNVSDISRDGYQQPFLAPNSGIVSMTYLGSERAIPNYNMMGIAKASLEAAIRYLAAEFSPKGIRVNGISAGAIKTLAVTGVKDYQKLIQLSESRTPDQQGVTIEEVGNACAFLISPLSSGIIGDIIYVDKGVHLS